ncbi:single-stranded DNA-binding protein [Pimelobacter simplex]|uniref:single-stranded DNA-binding protein n=1 Tax=Nocardioides simplex TaxID=2045 RepID=UPI003AB0F833
MSVDVASEEVSNNNVALSGRVAGEPAERELASGDRLCSCRLIVPRADVRVLASGRRGASVDVIDLVAWTPKVRRSMRGWRAGDQVRVEGELRRRFFKAGERTASRVEVEVSSARRTRRGASG